MPTVSRAATLAWCGAVASPLLLYTAIGLPGIDAALRVALLVVALLLPAGLLRRRPLAALLLMVLGLAVLSLIGQYWLYQRTVQALLTIAVCVAVGFLAALRRPSTSIPGAVLALLTGVTLTVIENPGNLVSLVVVESLAVVTAWVIGNSIQQRTDYAATQRMQAEARAVQAERLRIARELHDMIAHSIGIIAIQAGVGRRVIDTQPAEARDALTAIEDTSRDTLAALRRMLGTLRRSDPGTGRAPLDPAPGLADLDSLVTRTRDAGVHVEVQWHGPRHPLPPDIDLSAFRIVQEAVTNVIRHAGTHQCRVVVNRRTEELTIEITDDGPGTPAKKPGHGITGMRERVALLNGEFAAGPRPGGGFRVAARIPMPAASA